MPFQYNPNTGKMEWVEQGLAPGLPPVNWNQVGAGAPPPTTPLPQAPEVRNIEGPPAVQDLQLGQQQWQPSPDFKPLQGLDWSKITSNLPPPPVQTAQPETANLPINQDMNPEPYVNTPATPTTRVPEEKTEGFWDKLKRFSGTPEGLRALRDISEGLGGFQAVTGSMIRAGMVPKQGYQAEGIREQLTKAEDVVTPEMRASLEKALPGVKIPEGMSASKIKEFGIVPQQMETIRGKQAATERATLHEQGVREREQARKEQAAAIGSRQKERFARKDIETAEARIAAEPDKIYKDAVVQSVDKAQKALTNAKTLLANGTPQAVGLALSNLSKSIGAEVGVLTEQDIKRVEGVIGAPGMIIQVKKFLSGNYTPEQVGNWQQLIGESEKGLHAIKEGRVRERVGTFTKTNKQVIDRAGRSPEDVEQEMLSAFGVQAPGQDKVGQVGTYQGKRVRITNVYPDGSFDYDEVQ
jgi:hypothetical protein